MYLYSLGVYGNIIDVALPMDDNVSLLCMSCHGLKLVSCLKVIFFSRKKSFEACSMFAGRYNFTRSCICNVQEQHRCSNYPIMHE
jgi:hypothetical protein